MIAKRGAYSIGRKRGRFERTIQIVLQAFFVNQFLHIFRIFSGREQIFTFHIGKYSIRNEGVKTFSQTLT